MLRGVTVYEMNESGKPSLSPTEAERVRKAIERLYVRFGRNATELGRQIGRSQPAVTQLRMGTNTASLETAKRVAKLEGVPVTTYLDGSASDAVEAESDTAFPSKSRAARASRELALPDWAVQRMLTEPPPEGLRGDPGAVFWFRRVEQLLSAVGPGIEPDPAPLGLLPAATQRRRSRRRS